MRKHIFPRYEEYWAGLRATGKKVIFMSDGNMDPYADDVFACGADGIVTRAAGGGYTVKGATYEEMPEYGFSSDFDVVKGKAQTFACRVEGNKWYSKGTLSNGLTIEEVWERVEPK